MCPGKTDRVLLATANAFVAVGVQQYVSGNSLLEVAVVEVVAVAVVVAAAAARQEWFQPNKH